MGIVLADQTESLRFQCAGLLIQQMCSDSLLNKKQLAEGVSVSCLRERPGLVAGVANICPVHVIVIITRKKLLKQ